MAQETTNYKLVKPDETEFYDINVFNQNADKIDKAIKDMEKKIPTDLPPDLSGEIDKINKTLRTKLSKRTTLDATIPASGWTGDAAPYTVSITVTQLTGAADELRYTSHILQHWSKRRHGAKLALFPGTTKKGH